MSESDEPVPDRDGLLPGISAHGWFVISIPVFVVFFGLVALLAVVAFVGFSTGHPLIGPDKPQAAYVGLALFVVDILLIAVTRVGTFARLRRELRAGYSTLPLATLSVDIRDPRDGRILLPAGEGPREGIFRIRALRRDAARFPDRAVASDVPEPEPLRTLTRSATLRAAVAAAEPGAVLINAMRQPLVESAVAQYRPGARLHYTYLLAALPSGLQFWQEAGQPVLVAEIPRVSIQDVVEETITNDQREILGISVLIVDPVGHPTGLPFLPLRPDHPLLVVRSTDIPALIDSLRQVWGMSPATDLSS